MIGLDPPAVALPPAFQRDEHWYVVAKDIIDRLNFGLLQGHGAPEGVVVADTGTLYRRLDAAPAFYVKASGDGTATGWIVFAQPGDPRLGPLYLTDAGAPAATGRVLSGVSATHQVDLTSDGDLVLTAATDLAETAGGAIGLTCVTDLSCDAGGAIRLTCVTHLFSAVGGATRTDLQPDRLNPATDNALGLGDATHRWKKAWAMTASLTGLATYVDNVAALAGGLVLGDVYQTATGQLMVVF